MSSFRILTVCTGNVCRSPLAEQLLRVGLDELDVVISSAGTEALVGRPMDDRAAAYSTQFGGDPSQHRARQLTIEQLRNADLVLTAARDHRRRVVETLPRASQYTFTVREFERLLATLNLDDEAEIASAAGPAQRAATLVAIAASNRGVAAPLEDPADDDIVDPYRQDDTIYETSARTTAEAIRSIASAILAATAAFAQE
ncbi:low molecular weight phosphatase family protein [Humibacter ginsengiterrae]